jgi:hypothetical protein
LINRASSRSHSIKVVILIKVTIKHVNLVYEEEEIKREKVDLKHSSFNVFYRLYFVPLGRDLNPILKYEGSDSEINHLTSANPEPAKKLGFDGNDGISESYIFSAKSYIFNINFHTRKF